MGEGGWWRGGHRATPPVTKCCHGWGTRHFKPEWGGASPIAITITFSKDAGYFAGQVKPALLLDESDAGIYLLDRNLKQTYFVPRPAISLIAYHQQSR
jgi:hypothetical protein